MTIFLDFAKESQNFSVESLVKFGQERTKKSLKNYMDFPHATWKDEKERTTKGYCHFFPVFEPGYNKSDPDISRRTFAKLRPLSEFNMAQFKVSNAKKNFAEIFANLLDKSSFHGATETKILVPVFEAMANFMGLEDMKDEKIRSMMYTFDHLSYNMPTDTESLIPMSRAQDFTEPCPERKTDFPCQEKDLTGEACKQYCAWARGITEAESEKFIQLHNWAVDFSGPLEGLNPVSRFPICEKAAGQNLTWECWQRVITPEGVCFTTSRHSWYTWTRHHD